MGVGDVRERGDNVLQRLSWGEVKPGRELFSRAGSEDADALRVDPRALQGGAGRGGCAAAACAAGVPRVHIVNGHEDEALLAEVFSNEGIGTLIYVNEY